MFKNYFKTTVRNLLKNKVFSFINISGLAVGMACCIIILLYVDFELTYDRYHDKAGQIYRMDTEVPYRDGRTLTFNTTKYSFAPELTAGYPEIVNASRIAQEYKPLMRHGENCFFEKRLFLVDPSFLEIFSLPLEKGDPATALSQPNTIIITGEIAEKYFGDSDPMGKILTLLVEEINMRPTSMDDFYIQKSTDFTVMGVFKDIPANSYFNQFHLVAPMKSILAVMNENFRDRQPLFITYLLLQKDCQVKELEEKLTAYTRENGPDSFQDGTVNLIPLADINLNNSSLVRELYILSALAFMILMIACINFMNLSTARSAARSKEVGVKKVIGAKRSQLVKQFLGESIFLSCVALALGLILVKLFLPLFGSLVENELYFNFFEDWRYVAGLAVLTLFVGVVSGSYPALYLSSLKPFDVLRKAKSTGLSRSILRKYLVVVQFAISIVLIISTIVIYKQLYFMRNKDLGFDKENIIAVPINDKNLMAKYEVFRDELLKKPEIINVTSTNDVPPDEIGIGYWTLEGAPEEEEVMVHRLIVDYDFIDTYNIELLSGRNFSRDFPTDKSDACIINEAAARAFNINEPLGKRLSKDIQKKTVIGVVKDFHTRSMHENIESLMLFMHPRLKSYISLKIHTDDISGLLAYLENRWKEFSPNYPFEYSFIDDRMNAEYGSEQKISEIFTYSALLAIAVSCLGLFGLVSFTAEQRTKEIGIRKVLGASVSGLVFLLTKEFGKWVIIANIIAWPVAYIAMNKWLQDFAYRINLGWDMFIAGAVLALLIALITISYQSIKAATANPIDSLRYE